MLTAFVRINQAGASKDTLQQECCCSQFNNFMGSIGGSLHP